MDSTKIFLAYMQHKAKAPKSADAKYAAPTFEQYRTRRLRQTDNLVRSRAEHAARQLEQRCAKIEAYLGKHGPATLVQLVEALGSSRTPMRDALNRLRGRHAGDSRPRTVRIAAWQLDADEVHRHKHYCAMYALGTGGDRKKPVTTSAEIVRRSREKVLGLARARDRARKGTGSMWDQLITL